MTFKKSLCATAVGLALASGSAFATNGMNMESYGPIAGGMGGASMAYDNGTAALMNNPATLGLMAEGSSLDIALGWLGPRVTSDAGYGAVDSDATSFLMPAFGYASKSGALTWAAGVFAQGGMGTEYAAGSAMSLSGETNRSEVGVGRAMIAAAYNVNDRLNVGGSLDLVWAGMDLLMDASTDQLDGMATGGTLAPMLPAMISDFGVTYGRFEFSNSSDFTGKARGYGFGGKLGLTYKVSDMMTVGAAYHTKTALSDLKTSDATMVMGTGMGALPIPGTVHVRDFEWPATYGIGLSFTPNEQLQLALDVKRILWSGVMDSFNMSFTVDNGVDLSGMGGPDLSGATLDVSMPQNWKDQTVIQGGVAYQVNPNLVVRAGFNVADNPIPDSTVNPLFPAIIEKHYTLGFGYKVSEQGNLNASFMYAPNVHVTSDAGYVIDHKQYSAQVMYSHRF